MPGFLSCDPLPLVPDSRGPFSHTPKKGGTNGARAGLELARPASLSLSLLAQANIYPLTTSTVAHPPFRLSLLTLSLSPPANPSLSIESCDSPWSCPTRDDQDPIQRASIHHHTIRSACCIAFFCRLSRLACIQWAPLFPPGRFGGRRVSFDFSV